MKSALGGLAHPWCPKPQKFTGDILNLTDAETEAHQPRSDWHEAVTHQSREAAPLVRACDCGFRARNLVGQRLNFVRLPLGTQENAGEFFSDSTTDAGSCRQLPN